MFDLDYRLYPPDVDCELVSLVVIPRILRGDCGGFPMVPGADVVSHFSVPLEGAPQSMGTCTRKGWLVEVGVTSSHSFIHWFMGLNQPMPSSEGPYLTLLLLAVSGPNPPESEYW
jgi:hypothetical protein